MTTAMYAGSFDPIHLGHLAVIRAAAARFDTVWVVVATNPGKADGWFRADERVALAAAATAALANVTVTARGGLLVDAAGALRVDVLIRSATKERAAELEMGHLNRRGGGLPTVLMPADPMTAHISSSAIRRLVDHGDLGAARPFVPSAVADALVDRSGRRARRTAWASGGVDGAPAPE